MGQTLEARFATARVVTLRRPDTVMAKTTVASGQPWFATFCEGPPEKVKIMAFGYGETEEAALAALAADRDQKLAEAAVRADRARKYAANRKARDAAAPA